MGLGALCVRTVRQGAKDPPRKDRRGKKPLQHHLSRYRCRDWSVPELLMTRQSSLISDSSRWSDTFID